MKAIFIFGLVMLFALPFAFAEAEDQHEMGHQDIEHHDVEMAEGQANEGSFAICPVMGDEAALEYAYEYAGKTYYFCCPMCLEEFKKNPEEYISRIKEIELQAYQYNYAPEEIRVNKGDIVLILATSRDVPHGFYIQEYGINLTLNKDEVKKIEFLADKAGEFEVICSVYCGPGHHGMKAKLIVEE